MAFKWGNNEIKKVVYKVNGVTVSDDVNMVVYNGTTVFENGPKVLVAVGSSNIYYSEDSGNTWSVGTCDGSAITNCDTVYYDKADGKFIAYCSGAYKGQHKVFYISSDGKTWDDKTMAYNIVKMCSTSFTDSTGTYGITYVLCSNGYLYRFQKNSWISAYKISGTSYTKLMQDYVTDNVYFARNQTICQYEPVGQTVQTLKTISTDYSVFDGFFCCCNGWVAVLTDDDDEDNTYYQIEFSKIHQSGGPQEWIELESNYVGYVYGCSYMGDGYVSFANTTSTSTSTVSNTKCWYARFFPTSVTYGSTNNIADRRGCGLSSIDGYFYYPQQRYMVRNQSLSSSSATRVCNTGSTSRHVFKAKKLNDRLITASNYGIWVSDDGGENWFQKNGTNFIYDVVGK